MATAGPARLQAPYRHREPRVVDRDLLGDLYQLLLGELLAMLGRSEGATIAAIMRATHWQQHSVRGFFAGVVRKKLGLDLRSEKGEGDRVYRIVHAGGSSRRRGRAG